MSSETKRISLKAGDHLYAAPQQADGSAAPGYLLKIVKTTRREIEIEITKKGGATQTIIVRKYH